MTKPAFCLDDFELLASSALAKNVFELYRSGSGDERTLAINRTAFNKLAFRPRVLRDVSHVDLSTSVLGRKIDIPFGIAPSAMHCLAHPAGEKATATAAAAARTCMILSSSSTTSLEDVRAASGPQGLLWFQLNILKDRDITKQLVRRAEAVGYEALVLTVDDPVLGRRLNDFRYPVSCPPHLQLANFTSMRTSKQPAVDGKGSAGVWDGVNSMFDPSATWEYVQWLKGLTTLPIVIKGILTAEDARIAANYGVAAICVSNHGGRQLDSCPATIDTLPEVVEVVRGTGIEVFLDGGVRTGNDVIKALILGARAVFLGRPALWALATGGANGVRDMLSLLKEECRVTCALLGVASVNELDSKMICQTANL